jgi:hypothetical protein
VPPLRRDIPASNHSLGSSLHVKRTQPNTCPHLSQASLMQIPYSRKSRDPRIIDLMYTRTSLIRDEVQSVMLRPCGQRSFVAFLIFRATGSPSAGSVVGAHPERTDTFNTFLFTPIFFFVPNHSSDAVRKSRSTRSRLHRNNFILQAVDRPLQASGRR